MILKVCDAAGPPPSGIARLQNEYRIASGLEGAPVVRPLALERHEGTDTLVLEDFGGEPLEELLGSPMSPDRFLALAVPIAGAIAEIHRRGVIHRDIKPENILVEGATGEVRITEFGIATLLKREQPSTARPLLVEGTLEYIAPEQTGRVNRAVDRRTDLYSLGVVFYRMLTGRLPFEASDPLGWIHCHIARAPAPPAEVVAGTPVVLSNIVSRLLAKDPEHRYQSADGLKRDLERCHAAWRAEERLEAFPLGEHDVGDTFRIPQRLYGRDRAFETLLGIFHRVVANPTPVLTLVAGYSGIGKSSLVRKLHAPVVEERAIFLEGKFEQMKRRVPYAPIVQAVTEMVLDILADDEERRQRWRTDLARTLGPNARLIVDVVPQLALLIGEPPALPELPLGDAAARFRRAFRDFLGTFARPSAPLVLFLDDLQWADTESLALLEDVIASPETRGLLVIGAYRDNEVGPGHPLLETERRLRESGAAVEAIVVSPLAVDEVSEFLADALRVDAPGTRELAAVLHQKTGGNPFFIVELLKALRDEGVVSFDAATVRWRWDLARIRELSYTDNVVDLLVTRLADLAPSTREVLQVAACVGAKGSLELLAMACGKTEEATVGDLSRAALAGLVVLSLDTYAFAHDRMQQAAYALIPVERRSAVHLHIGELLRDHTPAERQEERIFDIVTHLNLGASLLATQEERARLAELNLVAGRKARSASAFQSAGAYFTAGTALLASERDWDDHYDLAYALHLERAECDFCTGDLDRARDCVEYLLRRARTNVDKAAAYRTLIQIHLTTSEAGKDIDAALEALRLFGVDMSPHPDWDDVLAEYEEAWRSLGRRSIEDVVQLPKMTDREPRLAMQILSVLFGPALWSDVNLFCLHICKMVNISLRHGNTEWSTHAYGWFGLLLGVVFHRYDDGYRYAAAGYELMRRSYADSRAKAEFFMEMVSIWTRPIDEVLKHARAAVRVGCELGDVPIACWSSSNVASYRLARGDALEEVEREASEAFEFSRKAGYRDCVAVVRDIRHYVAVLRGIENANETEDEADDQAAAKLSDRQATRVCWHYLMKLMQRFMLGDYEGARKAGRRCEALLWSSIGHIQVYDFHFFHALTLAAVHDHMPDGERREVARQMRDIHSHLREWATESPTTFSAAAALVGAEVARVSGDPIEAARGYERAVELARANGLIQNEAIAYEVASRFYRQRGIEGVADAQLREALAAYLRWGAGGKVAQLQRLNPQLSKPAPAGPTTVAFPSEQVDVLAIAKASQTISRAIVWEDLTETLLRVVLEQSGARKGCLILPESDALRIEAEAVMTDRVVVTRPSELVADSDHVPAAVVEYAWRTKAPVLLDDAVRSGRFHRDPYVVRHEVRSLLCLPILLHGEPAWLLYLENSLVANAFTPDRLTVLEVLAAQAAISLSNARLLTQERVARSAAEDAERRSAFLARAGELLAESLDQQIILERLAGTIVRSLADWCAIDVVEDRQLRRLAMAHAVPEKEPVLHQLLAKYPPQADSNEPTAMAIRTGETQLLADPSDETLQRTCTDAEHARLLRAAGTRNALAVPLVARGKVLGAITLVRTLATAGFSPEDVELAEDLAHRVALAVDNARLHRETEEAVRLRDEFLAIASHELKTPMTSLLLTLQMQLTHEFPPEKRASLTKTAERQATQLSGLITKLLDIRRIERSALSLSFEEVDLGDLVTENVARLEAQFARAHCTVTVHAPERVVGKWDRSRIEQVVVNLLSNAAKFGAGRPIDVEIEERDGTAVLRVIDRGIGIDPASHSRIFERFERAVPLKHYGGFGLGLYVCRQIVDAHGGSIRVDSAPGAGATFTVELPCTPRKPHAAEVTPH